MTLALETASHDDAPARRAVLVLAWGQAVLGAQLPVHFILGGLSGALLAPSPALATLPISAIVLASMLSAPVMSALMARFGRRAGFLLGAAAGATGGLLSAEALIERDFTLLILGAAAAGIYMSAHNFYRFAAADLASAAFRPKAIGWVMAGGLIAALIGPEIVVRFQDWAEPVPYAGAYQAIAWLNLIGALPLAALAIPRPPRRAEGAAGGRPWSEILRDRRIMVAVVCAMIAYALMNMVMTSTPLAMVACGFETADAAEVVRLHVLAMYAPSFVTGHLIARFGPTKVIAAGILLMAGAAGVALAGVAFANFALALILLGAGWNFGFVGATAMLAAAHRPEERARVQGMNDFLVFGLVTLGSLSSGALLAGFGWTAVLIAMLPALALAGGALASRPRPRAA